MTVRDILEKMQEILEQARTMPMSQSVLVNRQDLLDLINTLVNALPAEFDEAKRLLADREVVLAEARVEADHLSAGRAHARRQQHRHHDPRSGDLRAVRAPS